MGRRTGFCFFGFNFQNSTLYPVECTHSQFLFRGQLQTSLWRLSELWSAHRSHSVCLPSTPFLSVAPRHPGPHAAGPGGWSWGR